MSPSSSANTVENRDSCTEVRIERIVHNWTIKRFDFLGEKVGEKICSPWLYSRDRSEKWRLQFYPRGDHPYPSGGIDYVSLYLARDSPGKPEITAYKEMKISKSNIRLKELSSTDTYGPQGRWGYKDFLERSKLLTKNATDDDEFTISCVMDIPAEVTTSSLDAATFDSKNNQIIDHFRCLFQAPVLSDFTIIVGDKKFATHKVILASRSSVFAAMFEHKDLEENRKNEMKIENIEPDVVKRMLEFIYTDQVTDIKELASGLLEVADKYDLEKLRIMCEKTLYEGLNEENVAEILQLADLHRADTLKKYVMKYIVKHAPAVVKSNNWKAAGWSHELLLEVIDQLVLPHAADNGISQSSQA